jgi:hypothetical protein
VAEGGVVIHVPEYETRARTRTSATRNRMARFASMGSSLLASRNHLLAGNYCNLAPLVPVAHSRVCDRVVVRIVLVLRKDVETGRI